MFFNVMFKFGCDFICIDIMIFFYKLFILDLMMEDVCRKIEYVLFRLLNVKEISGFKVGLVLKYVLRLGFWMVICKMMNIYW